MNTGFGYGSESDLGFSSITVMEENRIDRDWP